VGSRQREQSFKELDQAQAFQLTLTTGKQAQGRMFVDPRAGMAEFLPLCERYISGLSRPCARTKAIYRSNFANPEVTRLLKGKSVLDVATMDEEVTRLLNVTLARYQDVYRGNVRRVIAGALDQAVRTGIIPRHALGGIQLGPRAVTAEQYEREQAARTIPYLPDQTVRMIADGISAPVQTRRGPRAHVIPGLGIAPWLQRTMGLRIREALGTRPRRLQGARRRHPLPSPVLAGDPGRAGAGTAQAPQGRRLPRHPGTGHDLGHGAGHRRRAAMPRPGHPVPALPHRLQPVHRPDEAHGISGAHTHALRHQFATEALDAS
jgi:integrase